MKLLEYAPPLPLLRRRAVWGVAAALGIIGLAVAAWRLLPTMRQRYELLSAQRQCLRLSMPPDQVVYEWELNMWDVYGEPVGNVPKESFVGDAIAKPYADRLPVSGLPTQRFNWSDNLIFMHERISPNGSRRLVTVRAIWLDLAFTSSVMVFRATVIEPASVFRSPTISCQVEGAYRLPGVAHGYAIKYNPRYLRIFWGQPDAANESRFTLRYSVNEEAHIVEGSLGDDGVISFRPLD